MSSVLNKNLAATWAWHNFRVVAYGKFDCSSTLVKKLNDFYFCMCMHSSVCNFIINSKHCKVSPSEEQINKLTHIRVISLISVMSLFCFSSMVLIESVKSARLTLLAMTFWSSTMLFLFIMGLKQKKDSILLRMKKITVTETFLGYLKRNSRWSILSQHDTADILEKNKCCQTEMLKHNSAC